MRVDQVFPAERPEMTSSATVDDKDFLFFAGAFEAFVRNFLTELLKIFHSYDTCITDNHVDNFI